MSKIEHSVDIAVPVREAYDQWTQFESFPKFMDGVESVRQTDPTHLHWIATIAGKRQEWDAEITEQTPDQRIAWTSTSGDRNAGAVDFHRVGEEMTRITLTMDVEPSGLIEKVGTAIGVASGQVEGDLKRFKEFIESRGVATGGWRGEVRQDDVTGSGASSAGSGHGATERELAGAGAMGSYGSSGSDATTGLGGLSSDTMSSDLSGSSTSAPSGGATPNDPYGVGAERGSTAFDTEPTIGSTGRGEMGSGFNDPADLGTGRRENPDA